MDPNDPYRLIGNKQWFVFGNGILCYLEKWHTSQSLELITKSTLYSMLDTCTSFEWEA